MKKKMVEKTQRKTTDFFKKHGFENNKESREVFRWTSRFIKQYRAGLEALAKM